MKKLKLFFACLLMAVLSIGQVWAEDVSVSFASWTTSISTYSATEWTDNGCTFTYANNNNKGWAYVRCGGKGTTASSTIKYNTKIGVPVESVVLNTPSKITNGSSSSITITGVEVAAYSNAEFTTLVSSKDLGTLSYTSSNCPTSFTITPTTAWAKDLYYKITISWTATGSKNCGLNVSGITFNEYEEIPSPSVSVSPDSWNFGTVHASNAASKIFSVSGSNLEAGDLTLTVPDGFSVSPSSIAVDGTLTATDVTVSKNTSDVDDYAGNLEITGGGLASAKTVALTMTVDADPEPTGTFELFSGDLAEGDYVICSGTTALKNALATNTNYIGYETVTVSEDKITNPSDELIWHIAASDEYWTIYNAAATNYAASTGAKNKGQVLTDISGDNADKALWTASGSSSYEFVNKANTAASVNANLRYNSGYGFACYGTGTGAALTLYKKSDGKPAAPTFTPAAGSYLGTQNVTISAAADVDEIRYTLNGSTPTSESILYTGAIEVSTTTTIKAIAIKDAVEGNVATATYTIINTEHAGTALDPYSVADAKAVIDGVGTKEDAYVSGIVSQVDSYNSTYKSITYWISADGTTSGQQLQVYSGKGIEGADFNSINDVVAKATVVVKGTLKKHNDTYEFDYNNELVSYETPAEPIVTLSPSSLNLEAEGNGTQEITLTATNFENEVNEITCAFYNTAACDGEAISQPAWITNLTDNNSNQVSFDVEDNAGEARQVWMKVTAGDGTSEASAVLAISQAKYTVDYAELPFAFDGGKADIATTNGMTHSGLGSDYSASPKLKFDGTGDWLIIHINEAPGKLTYDIKNNSFADGTFTVQESADGETYTEVASHTEIVGTQNEEVDLKEATRYVKFIYTEKVTGNVGLGNITISKKDTPEPPTADYTRGVTIGNYGTICLPKAGTIEGASIFEIAYYGEASKTIFVDEITSGHMDAGVPYIFQATAAQLEVTYDNKTASDVAAGAANGLHGFYDLENMATDEAAQKNLDQDDDNYILYNNQYWLVSGRAAYINNFRAYIKLSEIDPKAPALAPGRRRVAMAVNGENAATGFENIESGDAPMKVMIEGTMYILRGEKVYDATGRLVK